MRLVEQHVIKRGDPRYKRIDAVAFASKNLWNLANYYVRQSFIFEHRYLDNTAIYHLVKSSEAYRAQSADCSLLQIELLTYKTELVGIRVIRTEESYTSKASFLDREEVPVEEATRSEDPRFSGRRDRRWYYASDKRFLQHRQKSSPDSL